MSWKPDPDLVEYAPERFSELEAHAKINERVKPWRDHIVVENQLIDERLIARQLERPDLKETMFSMRMKCGTIAR